MCSQEDQAPVIFFRDVTFKEIESLVEYIYTGEVEVPGSSLQSFLALAHSLGVTGFSPPPVDKTPTKRKLEWDKETPSETGLKGEVPAAVSRLFSQPCTPSKSRSEPACLVETALQCSNSKKRKLQTQSLTDNLENLDPNLLSVPSVLLQRPVPPFRSGGASDKKGVSSEGKADSPLHRRVEAEGSTSSKTTHRVQRSISTLTKLKASHSPLKDQSNHAPSSSCPVPPSPKNQSSGHSSNFSFDSHFLDPDELAAKGATLLHHLAVWMIQQKKDSSQHYYQRYSM